MKTLPFTAALALALGLAFGGLACDVSEHCDRGQIYRHYDCYDVAEAGAGGAGAGGGGAGGGGSADLDGGTDSSDDSSGMCAPHEGFGATCTMTSECPCGLDGCNTYMNANYCTHTHCLADPSICPAGWTCLDVAAFDPVTGSVCMRP